MSKTTDSRVGEPNELGSTQSPPQDLRLNPIDFAVGCFRLGVKLSDNNSAPPSSMKRTIEGGLKRIPNIDNISIDWHGNDDDGMVDHVNNEPCFFPRPTILKIAFDLLTPAHVRERVAERLSNFEFPPVDRVRITTFSTYYDHVTFIYPKGDIETDDPSHLVILSREVLREALSSGTSSNVGLVLSVEGPSPFHADWKLTFNSTKPTDSIDLETLFSVSRHIQRGYDSITINAPSPIAETDPEEYIEEIFEQIAEPMGIYYWFQRNERHAKDDWASIIDQTTEFLSFQEQAGFRNRLRRVTASSQLLRGIQNDVARYKISETERIDHVNEAVGRELESGALLNLNFIIKDLPSSLARPAIDNIQELVRFYETRSLKSFEVGAMLMSAMVGGLIGAGATVAASNFASIATPPQALPTIIKKSPNALEQRDANTIDPKRPELPPEIETSEHKTDRGH